MYYDIEKSGERIRQLRIKSGQTQEKIAEKLNVDRSFYGRVESGKKGCSIDLFIRLSELFQVSLDYLILGGHSSALPEIDYKLQLKTGIDTLVAQLEQFKSAL